MTQSPATVKKIVCCVQQSEDFFDGKRKITMELTQFSEMKTQLVRCGQLARVHTNIRLPLVSYDRINQLGFQIGLHGLEKILRSLAFCKRVLGAVQQRLTHTVVFFAAARTHAFPSFACTVYNNL